jgi:hypothetical protein
MLSKTQAKHLQDLVYGDWLYQSSTTSRYASSSDVFYVGPRNWHANRVAWKTVEAIFDAVGDLKSDSWELRSPGVAQNGWLLSEAGKLRAKKVLGRTGKVGERT